MKSFIPTLRFFAYLTAASFATAALPWQDWGASAFADAQATGKPVFVYIDDPFSQFSDEMEAQTFANAEVASFLQKSFICVRVDRSAVPSLAAYGQQWLAVEQQPAGWPLNLWLTPAGDPIKAASYLPPSEEWGREGFMVVARRVAEQWAAGAKTVVAEAEFRAETIAEFEPLMGDKTVDVAAALQSAEVYWLQQLDADTGLFTESNLGLNANVLRFLLARGGEAESAALDALQSLLESPLRDPVDGGIFREAQDEAGQVPVFQKRLIDQASFALACLDAYAISQESIFAAGAKSVIDYAINRLSPGDGTFVVGENATTDPKAAGLAWHWDQLSELVGDDMAVALGALPEGNFDGSAVPAGELIGYNLLQATPLENHYSMFRDARLALQTARDQASDPRVNQSADAATHGLLLHVMTRGADELGDLDYGAYLLGTIAVLRRDFAVGTEFFSHLPHSELPPTASDLLWAGLVLGDDSMVRAADDTYLDAEVGLYRHAPASVVGASPWMLIDFAEGVPNPIVTRLTATSAPDVVVNQLKGLLSGPIELVPGSVLLALQQLTAASE